MKATRRDFIHTSAAFGVLSVTKADAQPATAPAAGTQAAVASAKNIGVVISTRDQPNHLMAFLQALNDQGWGTGAAKKAAFSWASADGHYGLNHKELHNHTKKHLRRHGVHLIVAAGGLTSAMAVAEALNDATITKK